jgi:predicted NBD/HSP70 family sugar kinase
MSGPTVVGIDIGGTKISLCAVDTSGEVLASTLIETRSDAGASVVVGRLVEAGGDLIRKVRTEYDAEICAVGVVTPGVVLPDGIKLAPNNRGWEELPLARTVQDRLGIEVVDADNDAKAATTAEARWGALAGATDAMLVNLGTGISAAAIVGGRLLRGAHGAALEIAYQVPSEGPLTGFLDGRAPLEETFSGSGLQASASALLQRRIATQEVFAAMSSAPAGATESPLSTGDMRRLATLGRRALDVATRAIANLAVALDPEVVAVSGGMLRSADQILPQLAETLGQLVPFPPRLVRAHFAEHAPLAGACLLGYRAAQLPEPEHLHLGSTGRGNNAER